MIQLFSKISRSTLLLCILTLSSAQILANESSGKNVRERDAQKSFLQGLEQEKAAWDILNGKVSASSAFFQDESDANKLIARTLNLALIINNNGKPLAPRAESTDIVYPEECKQRLVSGLAFAGDYLRLVLQHHTATMASNRNVVDEVIDALNHALIHFYLDPTYSLYKPDSKNNFILALSAFFDGPKWFGHRRLSSESSIVLTRKQLTKLVSTLEGSIIMGEASIVSDTSNLSLSDLKKAIQILPNIAERLSQVALGQELLHQDFDTRHAVEENKKWAKQALLQKFNLPEFLRNAGLSTQNPELRAAYVSALEKTRAHLCPLIL